MAVTGARPFNKSFKCAAAMDYEYRFVMGDTSAADTVKIPTADTDLAIGVLEEGNATAGRLVDVCMGGFTKVELGAGVTRWDKLQINGILGKAKKAAATGYGCAIALETGVTGNVIPIFFWGSLGDNAKT